MVRAHYGKKLSQNTFGTIQYDVNYDKDSGMVDVTGNNGFYFAGFWSFNPGVVLNLSGDILGGVQRMGNFRYAAGMPGGLIVELVQNDSL
jgi:hypothetical protein